MGQAPSNGAVSSDCFLTKCMDKSGLICMISGHISNTWPISSWFAVLLQMKLIATRESLSIWTDWPLLASIQERASQIPKVCLKSCYLSSIVHALSLDKMATTITQHHSNLKRGAPLDNRCINIKLEGTFDRRHSFLNMLLLTIIYIWSRNMLP